MSYEFDDGYKIRDQYGLHFMTFIPIAIGIGWIDLFSRKINRDIFLKTCSIAGSTKTCL